VCQFPSADYRGNRQYINLGNLQANSRGALILVDYPLRQRLKIYARAEIRDVKNDPVLAEAVTTRGYRAEVERAFLFHLEAFDWNRPQHITPRFTQDEVQGALAPTLARLNELEAENRALRQQLDERRFLRHLGSSSMKRQIIRVEPLSTSLEKWKAPTSAVTRQGDTLYVSGFPPFDPDTGTVLEASIDRQTEIVFEQMKLCLETSGSSLENVLKCTAYCTSVEKFSAVNAVYARYFPTDPPARVFVCVAAWPGPFDIEIDCVAAV
jgi:2-iminobutanoate/2-iminopropanoate deaminase